MKIILNNEEKEYINRFFENFRHRCVIDAITKYNYGSGDEYIVMDIYDFTDNHKGYVYTWKFKPGTMFKDMELEQLYTAEELGL